MLQQRPVEEQATGATAAPPSAEVQPAAPTPELAGPPTAVPAAQSSDQANPAPTPSDRPTGADQGDVVVRARDNRADPMSAVNVEVFKVSEGLDKALIGPAARAYGKRVPGPLRSGLRNFLNNLREPIVFANFLLQLKVGKAAETFGRFAINTTAGAAGGDGHCQAQALPPAAPPQRVRQHDGVLRDRTWPRSSSCR
jgi:phospholipid-binding lipoprotein MlaA